MAVDKRTFGMFCKIFLSCSFCICLVLLMPTYSKASSIYRQNINLNSRSNSTLNATNFEEHDKIESTTSFSLNNDDTRADCKCENGICVNNGKKDICTCPVGWGLYLSYECRECYCGKGINCTFDLGIFKTDKYCLCPDGISLKNEACEDNCVIDPCKNGGTCENVKEGYKCICRDGYLGENCKTRDYCSSTKCENGGTCKNLKDSFECSCKEGFTGKNCEGVDYCSSTKCENGGTCKNLKGSFECSCKKGFTGKNCGQIDPCLNHKCQNDGVCKPDGRSYTCDCKDPYWGDKCEYKCDCINGECHKSSDGHARCVCLLGFGKYSEHECRACDCGQGFNCTFDVGFFNDDKYCLCPGGLQVKNEKCKDFCEHSPCKHGGTCENIANDYKCTCSKDYYGKNCECTCKNGECRNTTKGHYECVCKSEYGLYSEKECRACDCGKGVNCTFDTDIIFGDDKYCLCPGGVKLKNKACEDFCAKNPCKNGGICTNSGDDYNCSCPKQYIDKNCEIEETCERFGVIECKEVGRHCIDRENGIGFTCGDCLENFEEENGTCVDNFCLSFPCKNNGICKMENGSFVCFCKHPFCGETCEVEINPTTSSHLNISSSVPDLKTTTNNSIWKTSERFNWTTYLTTKPSNYSHDYNLTTEKLDTTPSPVTETPNITLVDFLTTKPTNYSRDYNLTTTEVSSTPLTTTSDTVNTTATSSVNKTTIDTTATTVTVDTTTTSSEKPSTSDRGIQIIFRNDYTIRNLTEVKIKM